MQNKIAVYVRSNNTCLQSLDVQKEAIINYIKDNYPEVQDGEVSIYTDYGCSGADLNRPALADLRSDIKLGKYNIVVVESLARLTRNSAQYYRLVDEWQAEGVHIECTDCDTNISKTEENKVTQNTASSRLYRRIIEAIKEEELKRIGHE